MLSFLLPNRQVTPESTLHTETTPSVPRVESTSNNGIPTRSEHLFEEPDTEYTWVGGDLLYSGLMGGGAAIGMYEAGKSTRNIARDARNTFRTYRNTATNVANHGISQYIPPRLILFHLQIMYRNPFNSLDLL